MKKQNSYGNMLLNVSQMIIDYGIQRNKYRYYISGNV